MHKAVRPRLGKTIEQLSIHSHSFLSSNLWFDPQVNQAGPATKVSVSEQKALQQQSITSVSNPTDPDLLKGHAHFDVLVDMAMWFAGVGFQYPSGKFIRDCLTKAVSILPEEGEISRVVR